MDQHGSKLTINASARSRRCSKRRMGGVIAILFVVCVSRSTRSNADEDNAAAAMAVPASVSTVVEGGLWGERGSYRIVVFQEGFEHIYSKTYAQWLTIDDKGELRIEKSVRVDELSNLVRSVVGNVRFVLPSAQSKGVFEVEIANRDSQKVKIARLRMGKPGEVSVEMPPSDRVE